MRQLWEMTLVDLLHTETEKEPWQLEVYASGLHIAVCSE